jgi:hypothetical protein
MLGPLADVALRSIMLGGAAWLGLTLMRVRNPQVRMTVWSVVLIVSMAMPALTPWMRVTIPSDEASPQLVKVAWADVPWIVPKKAPTPAEQPAVAAQPAASARTAVTASETDAVTPAPPHAWDWRWLATGIYVFVGSAMLLRLLTPESISSGGT